MIQLHPLSFEAHPQFVAAKSLISPPICRKCSDSKIYLQCYPMRRCLDSFQKYKKDFVAVRETCRYIEGMGVYDVRSKRNKILQAVSCTVYCDRIIVHNDRM